MTLDDEVLVTPELAKEIDARDIHCGRTVRDADTEAPLPWVQLVAEETLPPFADDTTGVVREGVCPRCNRDGYFGVPHVPMGLRYKNMPERHASKDWLATWERFGNSRLREPFRDTVLAAPRYLASERLAELLRSRRVKGLELDPVDVPLVF